MVRAGVGERQLTQFDVHTLLCLHDNPPGLTVGEIHSRLVAIGVCEATENTARKHLFRLEGEGWIVKVTEQRNGRHGIRTRYKVLDTSPEEIIMLVKKAELQAIAFVRHAFGTLENFFEGLPRDTQCK